MVVNRLGLAIVAVSIAACFSLATAPVASATVTPGESATPYNSSDHGWETNGCNVIPESTAFYDFNHACDHHDGCYRNRWASRSDCDWWFYNDMRASCDAMYAFWSWENFACNAAAYTVYSTVYWLGGHWYGWSIDTPIYIAA